MRKGLDTFEDLDGYLYPILADKEENAIKMEEQYARTYPVFYDESKEVPDMLHQQVKWLKLGRMPGLLVVDKEGIIRYAYYGESMSDIPENEEIFEILREINQ